MTAVRATFTGFDSHELTGVTVTDQVLGCGSYATVLKLEYRGLKCAGKKINEQLLRQGDRRFEEECRLLSQVRHPNIVQFLGVYFQQGVQAPILVMEFLPTNVTCCIEHYEILPKEISYSILHDVALGLCYLHSQTPAIIHRDLSSNNVLLTPNMTAKIADLGVARMLNLTPLQARGMTPNLGTPAYMPPEVMVANPKYDTSVDNFSYGILMIHMLCGKWPKPQIGPNRTEPDNTMIPVSEAERREVFLQAIGNDHPLMDLIRKCINNHPQSRAHTSEIVERLVEKVLQFPTSFANRLDLMEEIERKNREIQELKREIQELSKENKRLKIENKTAGITLQDFSPQIGISWKKCANIPTTLRSGQTTVINGKVYCGGGETSNDYNECIIFCYDPSQDKWTTLPTLPVRWFGLGQVNGKLVAVGGMKMSYGGGVNETYTFDKRSRKWKEIIPPMPTARYLSDVLSLQSALVVAGGNTSLSYCTAEIEIFNPDTAQWYRTDPLPTACHNISLAVIGNTCYALGGYKHPSYINQAVYASIDDLLGNAVPANKTTCSGSSDTQSAWKMLPDTPMYQPAAAMLAGSLFAIGGRETHEGGADKKEVYMYSPSTNSWIYISDLPAPQSSAAVAVLSSTEILVIGGWSGGDRVNTVYKGTLHLK